MRCITVTPVITEGRDDTLKNCRPHYSALFNAIGMDDEDHKFWGLRHVHPELAGRNLSAYGIELDGEVIISVVELDDDKYKDFNVHNYYDWSDYIHFADMNDENNKIYSIELLKCYTGSADVEQVVYKQSAIKYKLDFKTKDCASLWRVLHDKYIKHGFPMTSICDSSDSKWYDTRKRLED